MLLCFEIKAFAIELMETKMLDVRCKLNSVRNKVWTLHEVEEREVTYVRQKHGVNEVVAKIIASRCASLDQVDNFLNPKIKNLLPDPFLLKDMKKAVARMIQAITNKERIIIFGDYDVDGATSSAIIANYLRMIGIKADIYIPDRIQEGYGPNQNALTKFINDGYSLCITVDCGTVACDILEAATKDGLDIIVIDHHMSTEHIPNVCSVINPNRIDEEFHCRNMAAVGISFLVLVALHSTLRSDGFFCNIKEPDMFSLLDLVALGTVCDVMSLTGVNRAIVKQGLKVMNLRQKPWDKCFV